MQLRIGDSKNALRVTRIGQSQGATVRCEIKSLFIELDAVLSRLFQTTTMAVAETAWVQIAGGAVSSKPAEARSLQANALQLGRRDKEKW